tara:strand:- start:649 stop:852 length:204 start_codon:yes stop_codon:yes gene_type:complete
MGRKKKRNKKKSFQQMLDYLNDQALMIKRVSREVFMDADTGTRKHKDKKKYNRKQKHKKRLTDESNT